MIKLGIIGTGKIAKRAVEELAFVPGVQISSVYNPNITHGHEFAAWAATKMEKKILTQEDSSDVYPSQEVRATLSLDELATRCSVVYIATPHGTHFEYVKRMLEIGRHVICEKPMCFSLDQANELYSLAKMNDLVLMEAIKTAYCPGFQKIQEVVRSGVIGEIKDVEATFTRLTPLGCREFDDRKYGGAFTEFGTYTMLPIFRFLGTDYKDVTFRSIPAATEVDGYTKTEFFYGTKAFASSRTGLTVKKEGQLVISGTLGYILVPSPWWCTKYFEVRYEDPTKIDKYLCEFEGDGLRYEFKEMVQRVNEVSDSEKWPISDLRRQYFIKEEEEIKIRAQTFQKFRNFI